MIGERREQRTDPLLRVFERGQGPSANIRGSHDREGLIRSQFCVDGEGTSGVTVYVQTTEVLRKVGEVDSAKGVRWCVGLMGRDRKEK
jgi:hypothetical protein